ncbi:MFS transporter [Actinomycetes bacterium KLBMP 9759]
MRLLGAPGMPAYYLTATLARTGAEMVGFALVLLVLERTGDPALAGLAGAAYAFPGIVSGPLLGAWLDRTAYRRTALAASQIVLATVMACMLAAVGIAPGWVVPVLAAASGVMLPMVSAGFTSMLPSIVAPSLLTRANAAEAASFGSATMAGPAAAATVAALVSAEAAVLLIVATSLVSAVAVVALPVVPPVVPTGAGERPSVVAAAVDGLRHLTRVAPLRSSTAASTLSLGATGLLLVALPLHVRTLGQESATSGYLWTAMEAGCVLTALLFGRWQHRWRPERTVLVTIAAYGAVMTAWPLAGNLAALIALVTVAGLFYGPMMPAMFGARQRYSPLDLQGRVGTTAASLRMGVLALGQAAGGQLVLHLETGAVVLVAACAQVAAALVGVFALRPSVDNDAVVAESALDQP